MIKIQGTLLSCDARGVEFRSASGRMLTADSMDARPEFGKTDPLAPTALKGVSVKGGVVSFVAPPKSVVVLSLH